MIEQGADSLFTAVDEVDDAGRKADLIDEFKDALLNEGILFRGFDDEGTAAGDGIGPEPEGDHEGEVEGSDGSADAQRLVDDFFIDAACGPVFQTIAHHERGDAAGGFGIFEAALDLAAGVVEGFAHIGGDETASSSRCSSSRTRSLKR
jgi:hypothetical protein